MECKNKKQVPLYDKVFEKRRRLSNLHKNDRNIKKRRESNSKSKPSKSAVIKSTTKKSYKGSKAAVVDQEDPFHNSDDSAADENYEPEELDGSPSSSDSETNYLKPSKRRKDKVKRRIFSPEKLIAKTPKKECNVSNQKNKTKTKTDVCKNSELITLEDLIGLQSSTCDRSLPDLDNCVSPPPKKLCLNNDVTVQINEIGNVSEESDTPPAKKTKFNPVTSPKKGYSTAVVCYKKKKDFITCKYKETVPNSYGIMSIDSNGVINLPNNNAATMSNVLEIESEENHYHAQESSSAQKVKKKVADPTKWKRIATKIARLKGSPYRSTVAKKKPDVEGRDLKPPCSCKAKCYTKISQEKRLTIFNQFWKTCCSWDQRRQFIVNNVKKEIKHKMNTNGNLETDRRKFSYKYKLSVDNLDVKVCQVMFLNTLSIGEKFVKVSIEKQLDGGLTLGDQRGKHVPANKSPEPMIKMVMDHIESYPSYESHYSREKSKKKYLGPDLSISLMYKHYKELMEKEGIPENLVAKEWLYRTIFNTKFNLSFKLPSLDTCDDCDAYERKLQDAIGDEEKEEITKKKEEHNKAATERYNLKKTDKEEAQKSSGKRKVLMFDLQKCLATPNLTNTQSFYLRKLWTLNLSIYDATSNVATNMIWSENISGRGGNEVASCLIRWAEENKHQLANVEELTFWSDNCAGQNRNLMIVMAYMWLLHKFPNLKIINHKYMLKGHTHMEVDQIHSQIEKKKKQLKTMQIAIPRDWSQFIRTCGQRRKFDVFDMGLQHFKDVTSLYKKGGPLVTRKKGKDGKEFKISECVWLQVQQEHQGILLYKNNFADDFSEISLLRNPAKGTKFPEELPNLRTQEKAISTAKYNDLITLLQWVPTEFHGYYKNLKHGIDEPDFPEPE